MSRVAEWDAWEDAHLDYEDTHLSDTGRGPTYSVEFKKSAVNKYGSDVDVSVLVGILGRSNSEQNRRAAALLLDGFSIREAGEQTGMRNSAVRHVRDKLESAARYVGIELPVCPCGHKESEHNRPNCWFRQGRPKPKRKWTSDERYEWMRLRAERKRRAALFLTRNTEDRT